MSRTNELIEPTLEELRDAEIKAVKARAKAAAAEAKQELLRLGAQRKPTPKPKVVFMQSPSQPTTKVVMPPPQPAIESEQITKLQQNVEEGLARVHDSLVQKRQQMEEIASQVVAKSVNEYTDRQQLAQMKQELYEGFNMLQLSFEDNMRAQNERVQNTIESSLNLQNERVQNALESGLTLQNEKINMLTAAQDAKLQMIKDQSDKIGEMAANADVLYNALEKSVQQIQETKQNMINELARETVIEKGETKMEMEIVDKKIEGLQSQITELVNSMRQAKTDDQLNQLQLQVTEILTQQRMQPLNEVLANSKMQPLMEILAATRAASVQHVQQPVITPTPAPILPPMPVPVSAAPAIDPNVLAQLTAAQLQPQISAIVGQLANQLQPQISALGNQIHTQTNFPTPQPIQQMPQPIAVNVTMPEAPAPVPAPVAPAPAILPTPAPVMAAPIAAEAAQVQPIINVTVPEAAPQPQPIVNVTVPEAQPVINVTVPEAPQPIVNVAAPEVVMPAPVQMAPAPVIHAAPAPAPVVVMAPEAAPQPQPVVNVTVPEATPVPAPVVHVTPAPAPVEDPMDKMFADMANELAALSKKLD
ncbi:MAG: hypothetical protein FWE38_03145 [Firmicutes bacterium]|nr:hypothetical protein [Bacillota bacterium]